MSDFFRDFAKDLGDDVSVAADENTSAESGGWIDTGSYSLNALLSGSIFGGIGDNKITAFAGESATGKTFFALSVVKTFLTEHPDGGVLYYDTEAAVTNKMMSERGIDTNRVMVAEVDTIQEFRTHVVNALKRYEESAKPDERPRLMIVLDSLGMLSTNKEVADIEAGSDTRDMTKSQLIKGAFRTITRKCAKVHVPMIITNHVYEVIGSYVPTKEMGGGTGLKYAASTIVYLGKRKERDSKTKDVVGNIIKAKTYKSRFTKEEQTAEILLDFTKGLNRYYGLVQLALKYGVFQQVSKRIELPDGTKVFESVINKNPEEYFTADILERLDEAARAEYSYGEVDFDELDEELEEALNE